MGDQDGKLGINAAVETLGVAEVEAFQRGEQLALLPSAAVVADAGASDEVAERRGPGRPPGSRNKRTQDWVDFIQGRYRSPLLFLAETYSRPVGDLARELSCKREDAFKIQVAAAKELAPYVHQKMPVAVEVDGKGVVQLVIEASPEVAAMMNRPQPGDGAMVIDVEVADEKGNDDKSKT